MQREPEVGPVKVENFKRVYEMHYAAVTRHLLYLLGSNQAAEDLAQEVFLRLYFVGFDKVEHHRAWLIKTANNLAYNYLNSEQARKHREQQQTVSWENNVVSLENKFLLKEEVRRIKNILDTLGERDRMAVLLRAEGYSYKEIAQVLKIPETSVGTVIARAKRKLCAELERDR